MLYTRVVYHSSSMINGPPRCKKLRETRRDGQATSTRRRETPKDSPVVVHPQVVPFLVHLASKNEAPYLSIALHTITLVPSVSNKTIVNTTTVAYIGTDYDTYQFVVLQSTTVCACRFPPPFAGNFSKAEKVQNKKSKAPPHSPLFLCRLRLLPLGSVYLISILNGRLHARLHPILHINSPPTP